MNFLQEWGFVGAAVFAILVVGAGGALVAGGPQTVIHGLGLSSVRSPSDRPGVPAAASMGMPVRSGSATPDGDRVWPMRFSISVYFR